MSLCDASMLEEGEVLGHVNLTGLSIAAALMMVEHARAKRNQQESPIGLEQFYDLVHFQVRVLLEQAVEETETTQRRDLARRQAMSYSQAEMALLLILEDRWDVAAWRHECIRQLSQMNELFETELTMPTEAEEAAERFFDDEEAKSTSDSGEHLVLA